MRFQDEHRAAGVFVAEGDKVVHRLCESSIEVVSAVLPENRLAEFESELISKRADMPIFVAPRKALEKLTGFALYQGVMALGKIPQNPAVADLIQPRDGETDEIIVALDGLSGADNMGTLLRTSAAFAAKAVLAGETSCSPWLRRAVRASMGEAFKIKIRESSCLRQDLLGLKQAGFRVIAAHPQPNGAPLPAATLTEKSVFCSEAREAG